MPRMRGTTQAFPVYAKPSELKKTGGKEVPLMQKTCRLIMTQKISMFLTQKCLEKYVGSS